VPVLAGAPATLSWREAFLLEHWAKEEKPDEMSLAGNALGWFWETDRSLLEPATAPMLAEDEQETFPQYRGLRLENITYVEYETGEAELYDLRSDPFEVTNLAKTVDKIFVDQLSGWLSCLSGCSGDACRRWEQLPGGMTLP
jgi:hypothetical protein